MNNVRLVESFPDDYENYYQIRCDETDIYWMGHKSKPDYEKLKQCFMERLSTCRFSQEGDKRIMMICTESKEDSSIGQVLFTLREGGIEIGISIKKEFQGLGLGTHVIGQAVAFAGQYSNILLAYIRDDNFASQHCFKKNGFVPTDDFVINEYPNAGNVKFRKYELILSNRE